MDKFVIFANFIGVDSSDIVENTILYIKPEGNISGLSYKNSMGWLGSKNFKSRLTDDHIELLNRRSKAALKIVQTRLKKVNIELH